MKSNQHGIAWCVPVMALLAALVVAVGVGGCGPSQSVEERAEDAGTTLCDG